MNNLLYIALNGYAGSGKDTVAKMLKIILGYDWENLEECKNYYFSKYTNPTQSATYNFDSNNEKVMCIAYADQLKEICSSIFGIPLQRFYQNKSNAWICINDKFQYTEIKPNDDSIITADEYYYSMQDYSDSENKQWLSLREILVYVGTYVLQNDINKKIFVNIVRNKIHEECRKNHNLQYIIITDNRFSHELDYVMENNGITMTINRNSIQQLDNIAEHNLDDVEDYDYCIDNSGSYNELFDNLWDLIHNNIEFSNNTISFNDREDIGNYLRQITSEDPNYIAYRLCTPFQIQELYKSNGQITAINPIGGPIICVHEEIEGTNITPDIISINGKYFEIYVKVN